MASHQASTKLLVLRYFGDNCRTIPVSICPNTFQFEMYPCLQTKGTMRRHERHGKTCYVKQHNLLDSFESAETSSRHEMELPIDKVQTTEWEFHKHIPIQRERKRWKVLFVRNTYIGPSGSDNRPVRTSAQATGGAQALPKAFLGR